ncbi:amidase, hydantoinase/carbamoylase family [Acidimicrobium ferrooxidans DSM 10331]|uniref:Amidase, hydantoinase/carbamoylase family n=1 Tax=Acidimicrobium ferrooxidans (strain DSM 10331 / JCM 15462 / NBRC 103882 / ICP) TaxID=525909 RepID=C7M028_ACIFD|nr:allantoate amidohydrolase [Acidimicrobium ferrooxidans]ACU54336.1 amidase, hydantoinase/carbamoylase family [Acidimicrobium ferrooxidans DSM 10331]
MTALLVDLLERARPIGRHADGGWTRLGFSPEETALGDLVIAEASRIGLDTSRDRAQNLWAWLGAPGPDALVLGSHLDSVPRGGELDGPLGVFTAIAALDALLARGWRPRRPLAVVAFRDEEGGRFGRACLGSRLLAGELAPADLATLRDGHGRSFAEVLRDLELEPARVGPDPQRIAAIGTYVELHIEQGRQLAPLGAPVGIATGIWPHARALATLPGEANHAGTTPLDDRRDPVVTLARLVLATRDQAALRGALATIGRIDVDPNAPNAVAGSAAAWLDVRAPQATILDQLLDDLARLVVELGGTFDLRSMTPATIFDTQLASELSALLGGAPRIATGAGHDAGILADHGVRAGMLFVRNPTGVSHAPGEQATPADLAAGQHALERVIEALA